jgi:26S proteasome regulatory subunit N3
MVQDISAVGSDTVADSKAESEAFNATDAINGILLLIEKSVKHKETRLLMGRLLRQTAVLRKHLDSKVLKTLVNSCVPVALPAHGYLIQAIPEVCSRFIKLKDFGNRAEHAVSHRGTTWMKGMSQ